MDLLYPVLRTVLICLVGFGIAYQGRRKGYTIFNLSGRFNRLQFIILFIEPPTQEEQEVRKKVRKRRKKR